MRSTTPLGDLPPDARKAMISAITKGKKAPVKTANKDPFAENLEIIDRVSTEPPKEDGFIQNSGIVVEGDTVLVPVMTEEENADNVAPFGKPLARISSPDGVSMAVFRTALGNAYAQFRLTGAYTAESIAEACSIGPGKAATIIASPEFSTAMRARGAFTNITGLTAEQDVALLVLTDPSDGRTLNAKLKALGITYTQFAAWKKQPAFSKHYNATAEAILADNSDSLFVVEQLGLAGNLSAIQYKHLLNGFYDPRRQDTVDLMATITAVFEVLTMHIKDSDTLAAIAADLKQVINPTKRTLEQ